MPRRVLPKPHEMDQIFQKVRVSQYGGGGGSIDFRALIDTGASHLTLPRAWKEKFPGVGTLQTRKVELASGELVEAEICGPLAAEIGDCRPIGTEVMFIDMTPDANGEYEPLIGYLPLQSIPVVIDLEHDELVEVRSRV